MSRSGSSQPSYPLQFDLVIPFMHSDVRFATGIKYVNNPQGGQFIFSVTGPQTMVQYYSQKSSDLKLSLSEGTIGLRSKAAQDTPAPPVSATDIQKRVDALRQAISQPTPQQAYELSQVLTVWPNYLGLDETPETAASQNHLLILIDLDEKAQALFKDKYHVLEFSIDPDVARGDTRDYVLAINNVEEASATMPVSSGEIELTLYLYNSRKDKDRGTPSDEASVSSNQGPGYWTCRVKGRASISSYTPDARWMSA